MTNDPTTTLGGGDAAKTPRGRSGGGYTSMTGDGDEQALGQAGEPRSFTDAQERADKLSALTDRVNAMREQVQQSAETARDWAKKQAEAAKRTASEKPALVVSVSAAAALAVGLLAGFVIGRATADY